MIHIDSTLPLYRTDDRNCSPLQRFLQLIGHTRDRWKLVWVDTCFHNIISEYFASPAPLIEMVHASDGIGEPVHLLGGETQNIRHLDLHEFEIRWDTSSFSRLKVLKLQGSVGETITTGLILDMLASSSELEHLKLHDVGIELSITPLSHPIRLDSIRSIELRYLEARVLDQFLRHIDAPHCEAVVIEVEYEPIVDESFIVDDSLRLFEPLFPRIHRKSGGSNFYARGRRMSWRSRKKTVNERGHPYFYIVTLSTSFISSLRFVERVLDNAGPEGLEVGIDIDGRDALQDGETVEVIRRLRSVTQIFASSRAENSQKVLQLLCNARQLSLPALPSLRVLSIRRTDGGVKELLRMARARFTHPSQSSFRVPNLEITVDLAGLIEVVPCRDLDFAAVTQIRSIDGVTLNFRFDQTGDGMLAAVWDDDADGPA